MAPSGSGKRRVVVIGAGFAGLAACGELSKKADLEVLLVDRHTYNTFQPLLYQVATAGLNPGDIAYPTRSFIREHPLTTFRQGTVSGIDLEEQSVEFVGEPPVSYDYLVVASGATTNFFGVPGASEHCLGLYTMEDAISVRDKSSHLLERAATFGTEESILTVVIVGGGPTGVELAGTLAELRGDELRFSYPGIDSSAARVVLIEQKERLLPSFEERLSSYAKRALEKRGVSVLLTTAVARVEEDKVVLDGGEVFACGMSVWSAGVRAGELATFLGVETTAGGRVVVLDDLRLAGHPRVFVVGDVAGTRARPGSREILPQLAQPAIQEGRHAARQILLLDSGLSTQPFSYKDKGIMATIGRRAAVAQLQGGVRLTGTAAWLAWLGLHVVSLVGFRNRFAVLLNWAWRYVFWRGGPRMVGGP